MKMRKLFVSQPMRDRTPEDIKAERAAALLCAQELADEQYTLIDSYFGDAAKGLSALGCLAKSLELLAQADAVYFADGWETARGCIIEHDCAVQYGLNIIHD